MEVTNIATLPVDLLHLLFEQIANGGDDFPRFATLFNCVVSSKHLANAGAVTALYRYVGYSSGPLRSMLTLIRICNGAPVKGGGNEGLSLAEQGLNFQRWAVLWRTIILSALGKTMFPYCRHLRMLDLRDLGHLLTDDKMRGKTFKTFFAGDLAQFHFTTPANKGPPRPDGRKTVRSVGDAIIPQAPLLEELSDPSAAGVAGVLSDTLSYWVPHLPQLRRLEVWDGNAFADETTRDLLHANCPNLESLGIYTNSSADADHVIAALVGGMQSNKLTYFENFRNCGIGEDTCLALSARGDSLRTLKLFLTADLVSSLGLLQGCTTLRELTIGTVDRPVADLKATQNDTYLEILEWLKNCSTLRRVAFANIASAPDLALPLLQNKDVRLESLTIDGKDEGMYIVKDHQDFHQALAQQHSLRSLHLNADPEPMFRDNVEALISSLCSLSNLEDLWLGRISDYFTDEHIKLLTRYLPDLRELSVGGYGISDGALTELPNLMNLKSVTFSGLSTFVSPANNTLCRRRSVVYVLWLTIPFFGWQSTGGITDFVGKLGEGNMGLVFTVDAADPDSEISMAEQELLRELFQTQVDGRFEYQLLRGDLLGPGDALGFDLADTRV